MTFSTRLLLESLTHLILLAVFAGLLFYSFHSEARMIFLYGNLSFYIIFALFLMWGVQSISYLRFRQFQPADFIKSNWCGIGTAFLMSLVIFNSVPVYLKILNDESNLLTVSLSMFNHQNAFMILISKYFHETFHVVQNIVPNRPLAFPFLTYLVHAIAGYDYHNAFIANFIVMFLFLSGAYVCTRHFTDSMSGIAAIFLVAAFPVFSIYGASGGYDLFSTFVFYLAMIVLYAYLKTPSASAFALLWMTLLVLVNIRYESIIFFVILIPAALFATRRLYFRQHSYIYSSAPLLLLPYLWQRFLSVGTYENPDNVPLFSITHFIEHAGIFLGNFLNLNWDLPYAGVLNLIALSGTLYLFSQILSGKLKLKPHHGKFWLIFGVCLAAIMTIVLSHFMGLYTHPSQARLFFYFCIFCALSPIVLKVVYPDLIASRALLIFAVVVFILYHPIAIKHEFVDTLINSRVHKQEQKYIDNLDDDNILIISPYPGRFACQKYGSISYVYANGFHEQLKKEFKGHLYSKIILIQWFNIQKNQPFGAQKLNPVFKVDIIKEIQVSPNIILRIGSVAL